jgi:hydrogenase maturation protease
VSLQRGGRVVLRPRADGDVLMRALDGRRAVIDAIEEDMEGRQLVAVVLEDDPARDIGKARRLAHRFFLAPEEVEQLGGQEPDSVLARVLVAGIGNVFLGDDAFGVEVVKKLKQTSFPSGVNVVEFGIRGMDLVYALGDGYDAAILIDAAPRGAEPGTIEVIEADDDAFQGTTIEGHGMHPSQAIALARQIGAIPARLLVVACEAAVIPSSEDEFSEGLSEPVAAAVDRAARLVIELVDDVRKSYQPNPEEVTST